MLFRCLFVCLRFVVLAWLFSCVLDVLLFWHCIVRVVVLCCVVLVWCVVVCCGVFTLSVL